jgi:hypothetical protein
MSGEYVNIYLRPDFMPSHFRDALVLGESEKEAKDHFRAKLQESRRNSFFTSMNWFIHGLAKDNRQ